MVEGGEPDRFVATPRRGDDHLDRHLHRRFYPKLRPLVGAMITRLPGLLNQERQDMLRPLVGAMITSGVLNQVPALLKCCDPS